jgi:Ankyrin repeats (many copies)
VSINITFPDGKRPLHVAASEANATTVELLLAAGARPDERTPEGQTALELAELEKGEFESWAADRQGAKADSEDAQFRNSLLSKMIPAAKRCIELLDCAAS